MASQWGTYLDRRPTVVFWIFPWVQDLQGEAPYHLLHLKIAVEKDRFSAAVEECRAELERETKLASQEGSEKIIKEHRVCATP